MIQNTQYLDDEVGNEETKFKRAYVEGKIGGVNVLAGRYNAYLVNGNLYDEHADGIELSYGNDVKFTAFAMKPTDQNARYIELIDRNNNPLIREIRYGKAYGAKVETNIGVVKTTAGYTVFKDGELHQANDGITVPVYSADVEDNKVWNVGVSFDLAKDLVFLADYLKCDWDKIVKSSGSGDYFKDDEGIVIGLNYKGAKASEPGTYGVYANYYDQAKGTAIAHTMNGYCGNFGFKGYMIGANYTLAKNIVASLEWYNLESKGMTSYIAKDNSSFIAPEQDLETLWAQVVFTF